MESLALLASIIVLVTVGSGPLALLATIFGFRWIGATIGLFAVGSGVWLSAVAPGVSVFGIASAAIGTWCVLQVCQRTSRQ